MIVMFGEKDGRPLLFVGLSFLNLDKLRAGAPEGFIQIDNEKVLTASGGHELPMDVVIFAGETEQSMAHQMSDLIGPETHVSIDKRFKS